MSLGIATRAFTRTILELIRDAGQPLCVREISDILAKRVCQGVEPAGVQSGDRQGQKRNASTD